MRAVPGSASRDASPPAAVPPLRSPARGLLLPFFLLLLLLLLQGGDLDADTGKVAVGELTEKLQRAKLAVVTDYRA